MPGLGESARIQVGPHSLQSLGKVQSFRSLSSEVLQSFRSLFLTKSAVLPESDTRCACVQVQAEEPVSSLKARVQARLRIPAAQFDTWEWAAVSSPQTDSCQPLDDPAAPVFAAFDKAQAACVATSNQAYIGMLHEAKTHGRVPPPRSMYAPLEARIQLS